MTSPDEIAVNLAAVQARMDAACQRAGRDPGDVQLIAVSKKMPASAIRAANAAGALHFGENRVEEATQKMPTLQDLPLHWHMIGHIQSRKAQDIVNLGFTLVHSVDSLKLAQRLDRFAGEAGHRLPILLECNVSGEESKSGWAAHQWQQNAAQRAELWQNMSKLSELPHLQVLGLMTMAPIVEDAEETRPVFQALAQLRNALQEAVFSTKLPHLSMGMTDDFEVAIEEGATLVRVGRAIFGERPG